MTANFDENYLVVNMSQVVRYREQVEEQKIEKVKLIK